jgi:hypothetical protein
MVAARCSASRLAPTTSVQKVSRPARRVRRTRRCHSRRADRARTSQGPQDSSIHSRETGALDQNDTVTVAETIRLTATMMRRNSSAVENWWARYSRMVR